mmetsp:Transcript_11222/g.20535  ORF Transcript_11222/g.20535 Transcript_11222/m.20535 type:complete len:88 (-) Transcript_11222:765-1028(-)
MDVADEVVVPFLIFLVPTIVVLVEAANPAEFLEASSEEFKRLILREFKRERTAEAARGGAARIVSGGFCCDEADESSDDDCNDDAAA